MNLNYLELHEITAFRVRQPRGSANFLVEVQDIDGHWTPANDRQFRWIKAGLIRKS